MDGDNKYRGDAPGPDWSNECTGSFTVPSWAQGQYTIQWVWYGGFNHHGDIHRGLEAFKSCMDFTVDGGAALVAKPATVCPVFVGGDFNNPGMNGCIHQVPAGKPEAGMTMCEHAETGEIGCAGEWKTSPPPEMDRCTGAAALIGTTIPPPVVPPVTPPPTAGVTKTFVQEAHTTPAAGAATNAADANPVTIPVVVNVPGPVKGFTISTTSKGNKKGAENCPDVYTNENTTANRGGEGNTGKIPQADVENKCRDGFCCYRRHCPGGVCLRYCLRRPKDINYTDDLCPPWTDGIDAWTM